MYAARATIPVSKQTAYGLSKAASRLSAVTSCNALTRSIHISVYEQSPQYNRAFSTSSPARLTSLPPATTDGPPIRKTIPAFPHPPYEIEQLTHNVYVQHRPPRDFSDRVALSLVRLLRWGTDIATGYKHDVEEATNATDTNAVQKTKPYRMSERKWLIRILFLESVAGVPGMVGGMLRHLHSIRRMKRDNGWIETLLEEAYNERMHLLTFLQIAKPGPVMKFFCLGAQGVFFNSLFLSYLISPRTCHRFVGYLEEEAVFTYTLAIADLDAGKLPEWEKMQAPEIAVNYWKMPEGKRSMRDLLLYVRADEAKHREVNHTLGNLKAEDPNPFVEQADEVTTSEVDGKTVKRPGKGIDTLRAGGWERDEVV